MPRLTQLRDAPNFPYRAMQRVDEDPISGAIREIRPPILSKIVKDPKRDRFNGQKGSATRLARAFVKRLA